jgi:archaetidylinositol phosphate synthase
MLDTTFRNHYEKLLIKPLLALPFAKKLSPIKVTLIGLFIGVLTAPLLAFHFNVCAIIALLLSGYFDTLDGALARLQNTTSPRGAVIDIISDRIVEFVVIFGLFLYDPTSRALPTILMLGSVLLCVTSFLVVGIFSKNDSEKSFHYSPGIMERAEAFTLWIAMILWQDAYPLLAYTFTALVLLTTAIRLTQFFRCCAKS